MSAHYTDDFVTIHHGDCLEVMASMEPCSIDAIVSDPPYGIEFMGRDWDHGVPGEHFWREALRVAKPGAHLVAFGGTRTYHRLTCAIEDAGWEIRDCLGWLYGSGFPKSLDVSKAIDKAAGVEFKAEPASGVGFMRPDGRDGYNVTKNQLHREGESTEAAQRWQGWGTALKPSWEPIVLARKPLGTTVARCVQEHGTGALNIDGCRVATDDDLNGGAYSGDDRRANHYSSTDASGPPLSRLKNGSGREYQQPSGRWPANICHDGSDEVLAVFPNTESGDLLPGHRKPSGTGNSWTNSAGVIERPYGGDAGSAARFFYCAKPTKAERDMGLFGDGGVGALRDGGRQNTSARRNFHPTVKPVALMRWLVRLVTPPDGVVLDPFMGSGTTLIAARAEGHGSIGIDLEADHCAIAKGRMSQGVLL